MIRLGPSRCRTLASAAFAIMLASTSYAALADDASPPGPGVARLSALAGSVDVKRGDSGDTVAADVNAPLSAGDYLSTQADSHAEVEFDRGTALRLAADTQLRFTQLEPAHHELELAAGTVDLRVRRRDARAQILTPQATIAPDENGSYLVAVDDAGNSQVTVRAGRADVVTAAGTQSILPGTTLAISGDADHPVFRSVAPVAYGDFDAWIAARDRDFERVADDPYLDNGMVGANDLYGNGRWIDDARYGQVWVPNVAAGWAPYHDGRWVWEPYYGWTWIEAEPWGWAPFHYGNWFYAAGTGWAWCPGPYAVAQPYVYRPALVAFFTFGNGFGTSLGFGNIGWVPIAPFEPYHPWWGANVTNTTINNTTINNVTITKVYTNANAPGAVASVGNGNFANGNFSHIRTLAPRELRRMEPIASVVPIVPTPRNLAFREHESAIHPLAPVARFAAFRATGPVTMPTFAEQQRTIQSTALRAYPRHATEITRLSPLRAAEPVAPALARPALGRSAGDPFARFHHTATPPVAPVSARAIPREPPVERAPLHDAPVYRAPYDAPVYRASPHVVPATRVPVVREPKAVATHRPVRRVEEPGVPPAER